MSSLIQAFSELTPEQQPSAGGKGSTLARLHQAGYPVPDGFVILPNAFDEEKLTAKAWMQMQPYLDRLRNGDPKITLAVRSSALSEDSAQASFAGEFETVLDVHTDETIRAAIRTVRQSRKSERVQAYSQAHGLDETHDMAVVVMQLVRADISGVLFTADPVSGSYERMTGNFVYGFGEELVSGEADPFTFTLSRPKGRYNGPRELERFARKLYKLANHLEKELEAPQDIEWAVAGSELFLLQSRPITTLRGVNLATGEWNSSLQGDFLWTNVNAAEARPDVMTPFTWTFGDVIRAENQPIPGNYPFVGNIGGRIYMNVTITLSMFRAMGLSPKRMIKRMVDLLGPIPEGMEVPLFPFPLSSFFAAFPGIRATMKKEKEAAAKLPDFLTTNPDWCRQMRQRIQTAQTGEELLALLHDEIMPYFVESGLMMTGATRGFSRAAPKLRRKLTKLVGETDANTLLSNLSSDADPITGSGLMASMGPVVGVAKVARGEMSREEYLECYGHRGPHEMELSIPRPAEDPNWLDQQLAEYAKSPVDVDALLAKRRAEFDAAWARLKERHPWRARFLKRRLEKIPPAARLREAARSETTRTYAVIRAWAVLAGELLGLDDDVFFLTHKEVQAALAGDEPALAKAKRYIPARRETHTRYSALPPYPSIIRGRFDPFQWAADPNRRNDIYDAHAPVPISTSDTITGFAGAAGRVEGLVCVLGRPEDGNQLQEGEILVAVTTNVGWTPIFPRAAAVVTDVGAPLSHAAIVARELGIPAVVGCVEATTRLHTGDRVRVDGGQGVVEILETA
jgi:pyruvate,water dikinase